MDQADGLVRWGEHDEAERLAGRAASMRIVYGPFEQKPQDLLQRIAAAAPADGRPPRGRLRPPGRDTPPRRPARDMPPRRRRPPRRPCGSRPSNWSARPARPSPPANWIRPRPSPAPPNNCGCPMPAFGPGEDRPGLVLLDLRQMRAQRQPRAWCPPADNTSFRRAAAANPTAPPPAPSTTPANDPTRNVPAGSQQPAYRVPESVAGAEPGPRSPAAGADPDAARPSRAAGGDGARRRAWRCSSRARTPCRPTIRPAAYEFFRQAANYTNDLDPVTAQRLQDHLQMLSAPSRTRQPPQPGGPGPTMADEAAARQQVLVRQVAAELAHTRIQRPRPARDRSQGRAGHVGGGAEEGRSGRPGHGRPRSTAAPRGPRHRRNQAIHRAEPAANRTGRKEQPRPPGGRARAADEGRGRTRSSPC